MNRLQIHFLFYLAAIAVLVTASPDAAAHPMLENALDVVIYSDRVVIDARIAPEQIRVVESLENKAVSNEAWQSYKQKHAQYVAQHLDIVVDGLRVGGTGQLTASAVKDDQYDQKSTALIAYRVDFLLQKPPSEVMLTQGFLRQFANWNASCVLRIRQSTQTTFDSALLEPTKSVAFDCAWDEGSTISGKYPLADRADVSAANVPAVTSQMISTNVNSWKTLVQYALSGIRHILTGYDHLLFVAALILAAESIWDLIKVVSAFTVAHSITLTLAVFKLVPVVDSVVEPLIAASIVFVAIQNIFWPKQSKGWARLLIAFGFGLFHGMGYAGGLSESMRELPVKALWVALIAFSIGVEMGHQIVVIPFFSILAGIKRWNKTSNTPLPRIRMAFSSVVCLGGVYFLLSSIKTMWFKI